MNKLNDVFKNKKILITGSNGFIGRNLVEKLQNYSSEIYGLDMQKENKNENITYFECDITRIEPLKEVLNRVKPHYIFHLAAVVSAAREYSLFPTMLDIHVRTLYYFYQILKESKELELFINFGSTEEYGDYGEVPFQEDFFEKSSSPYSVSKTAGIHFAYLVGKNEKFPIISIRPGVLFGKYQSEQKFIPYIIKHLKEHKELHLTACEQMRDFIHVDRFIDILFLLISLRNYTYGEIYNISSGESISLRNVVEYAKEQLSSESKINYGALQYRENEMMKFNVSNDKVKKALNNEKIVNQFKEDFKKFLKNQNHRE